MFCLRARRKVSVRSSGSSHLRGWRRGKGGVGAGSSGTHNWDSNCDVAPEWEGEGTQQGVGSV